METDQTERSGTSAYKIQTPGNYPEESIQHSGHGESLKSRTGDKFVFAHPHKELDQIYQPNK
jgi:hypothetical protein